MSVDPGMNSEGSRCPSCNTMAHGKFIGTCAVCGVDKVKLGYVIPERKPFKNPLFGIKLG